MVGENVAKVTIWHGIRMIRRANSWKTQLRKLLTVTTIDVLQESCTITTIYLLQRNPPKNRGTNTVRYNISVRDNKF